MLHPWSPATMLLKDASAAMYQNSEAFKRYLRKRDVSGIASSLGIHMKATHTITPRVRRVSLSTLDTNYSISAMQLD